MVKEELRRIITGPGLGEGVEEREDHRIMID
jgi:hypothetical protein